MNLERLLDRFLRYVQVDTTAGDASQGYPSSPGQWELGKILVAELRGMGLRDATQDENALVLATLPGNGPAAGTTIALNAHLDTSPETTGANVRPQVWRNYQGQDLTLPGDPTQVIRVAANPELAGLVGHTLITSDGTTLLGADDKAGVAAIMEAAHYLVEHPQAPRPTLKLLFTCDEEIGHGVDRVDLARLGAVVGYTLDGSGVDQIDVETFSADLAIVLVRGVNIHPSMGKGRMINALRVAADFVGRLPQRQQSPETTDGRQGFLHPYKVEGGVAEVTLHVLLRDFDTASLDEQAALLRQAAQDSQLAWPGAVVDVRVEPQYRNLADGLKREPRAVEYAERAFKRLGRQPQRTIVRGGTDGSRLTELGLPTPNLSTGEHNPHSPLEWTCLEEMGQAAQVIVELAAVWANPE